MPFQARINIPLPESPFRHSPLFVFALLMIAGIVMGWAFRSYVDFWTWLVGGVVCALVGLSSYILWSRDAKKREWSWYAAVFSLIMYSGAWCLHSINQVTVQWPKEACSWVATVENIQKVDTACVNVDVRIKGIYDLEKVNQLCDINKTSGITPKNKSLEGEYAGKKVRVRLEAENVNSIVEGDCILFNACLREKPLPQNPTDFNYSNYLLTHGISGQVYVPEDSWAKINLDASKYIGWRSELLRYRRQMLETYRKYIPDANALAVISALTLGDKTQLNAGVREVFSETGTSHVLALSGLHLGILFFLFNALLIHPIKRRALRLSMAFFAVLCLWAFTFLVGAPLSLLRSVTMLTMLQLGVLFKRTQNATLNNLSFAAIVLLIADPLSLFDVGFQLSFVAVLSIIFCNQYLWQRFRLPLWEKAPWISSFTWKRRAGMSLGEHLRLNVYPLCKNALQKHTYLIFRNKLVPFITVSLSAQWGTMPLIIYYFHIVTPYTFIANFVVIPSAMVLLSLSVVFFVFPFASLQAIVAKVMQYVLQFMTSALANITEWPFATFKVYVSPFLPWLIIILPICLYIYLNVRYRDQRRFAVAMFVLLLTLGVTTEALYRYAQRVVPQLCVYKMPRATCIHFVHSAQTSYIYTSTSSDTTRQQLNYLTEHYFAPLHLTPPEALPKAKEHFRNKYLAYNKGFFIFHHKSLYLLNTNLVIEEKNPSEVIDIDFLVVSFGCWMRYSDVSKQIHPRQVILSSDFPYSYRQIWIAECKKAHIPCHDVNTQGAFLCDL